MNRLLVGASDHTDLLLQFARADFPRGLTFIDPDGTVAEQLADIIPAEETNRVLYFDPSDLEHPVPLNILHKVPVDRRPAVAEDICTLVDMLFPEGPETLARARSSRILQNCLRLLLDTPGSTLLGVSKLLRSDTYRQRCLKHCGDPLVHSFWQTEFAEWDTKFRREAIAPLLTKVDALLGSPDRRNILCQKHCTPLDGKIVIANLNRAKVGRRTALLLGSLLIVRSAGPLYINNFGFFASDHLAELFSQSRSSVSLRSLPKRHPALRDELLSIEEKFVFTSTPTDAEQLALSVGIMNPRVLTELAPGEVRSPTQTFRPEAIPSLNRLAAIRRHTRACHTVHRKIVEAEIGRFLSLDS